MQPAAVGVGNPAYCCCGCRCFEGAIAATSAPLVGLMSQRIFGFSGASTVSGDRQRDLANARALGNALLAFCCFSWTFCFLMYSGEWVPGWILRQMGMQVEVRGSTT